MKNFIRNIILVLTLVITFTGCKKHKTNFHKLKYEIEFYNSPPFGASNSLDVLCNPQYSDDENPPASINKNYVSPGYKWDYEYWQLIDGKEIKFIVNPQLHYHFTMRVYIDGELVSEREIQTSTMTYYSTNTIYMSGLNDDSGINYSVIRFTYQE